MLTANSSTIRDNVSQSGPSTQTESVIEIKDPVPSRHGTYDRLRIRGFKPNYACPRKTPRQVSQMLYEQKLKQRREKAGEEER